MITVIFTLILTFLFFSTVLTSSLTLILFPVPSWLLKVCASVPLLPSPTLSVCLSPQIPSPSYRRRACNILLFCDFCIYVYKTIIRTYVQNLVLPYPVERAQKVILQNLGTPSVLKCVPAIARNSIVHDSVRSIPCISSPVTSFSRTGICGGIRSLKGWEKVVA